MTPIDNQKAHEKAQLTDEIVKLLRSVFPHGHPDFLPTTVKELQLHNDKNHDYASGGTPLGNFERVSKIFALYPGLDLSDQRVYALVLAMKQIDAVLWGLAKNVEHKVEGLSTRLADIGVYAKIVMCMCIEMERLQTRKQEEAQKSMCAASEAYGPASSLGYPDSFNTVRGQGGKGKA